MVLVKKGTNQIFDMELHKLIYLDLIELSKSMYIIDIMLLHKKKEGTLIDFVESKDKTKIYFSLNKRKPSKRLEKFFKDGFRRLNHKKLN